MRIVGIEGDSVQKKSYFGTAWLPCDPLNSYIAITISEKLATNIAMEVNAAISRIMSVIWLSFALMFLICSMYVLLSTGFHPASAGHG